MYWVYKKSKSTELPRFDYTFKGFKEFYEITPILTMPVTGMYYIQVKSDSYEDVKSFINVSGQYDHLSVYVEVNETLLEYLSMRVGDISLLQSKSNMEIFKELITRYEILFDKGCIELMYFAIPHTYEDMIESLDLVKQTYAGKNIITKDDLSKLFILDNIIYPRTVLISYLRMFRGRESRLLKCVEYFGNDLVFYSMRKGAIKLLEEKANYLKTGEGSYLAKVIPQWNLIKMNNILSYSQRGFKDIVTLMRLYEKGATINDTLQKRTYQLTDEEYYSLR